MPFPPVSVPCSAAETGPKLAPKLALAVSGHANCGLRNILKPPRSGRVVPTEFNMASPLIDFTHLDGAVIGADLGNPETAADLAGQSISDFRVPRNSLDHSRDRIRPQRMSPALALQYAPMPSKVLEEGTPLHAA